MYTISIIIITFILLIYLLIRNERVYKFKMILYNLSKQYNLRSINKSGYIINNAYKWFYNKWHYLTILFSFKPLKLRYWYTEDELTEILK